MRLTQAMRNVFVKAAMDDVPQTDYQEAVRKLAVESALRALPAIIRKAYADKEARPHLDNHYERFGSHCHTGGVSVSLPGANGSGKFLPDDKKAIAALVAEIQAQEKRREELKSRLSGAAAACSTRKALAELLPDFAKYLPAETEVERNLPVITGLVDQFAAAGWPKAQPKRKSA